MYTTRVSRLTLSFLFAFGVFFTTTPVESHAAPSADSEAAEGEAPPPAGDREPGPDDDDLPEGLATPGEPSKATVDAEVFSKECENLAAKIQGGDFAAIGKVSTEKKASYKLAELENSRQIFTCLAAAGNDKRYCDLLLGDDKKQCENDLKLLAELKKQPPDAMKAYFVYYSCSQGGAKGQCEIARAAIQEGDAAKCAALTGADYRTFCEAIAAGDAAKCGSLSNEKERGRCEAYATDDASRCPREWADCTTWVRGFASLAKEGLAGYRDINAAAAAASLGKKACKSLVADLSNACSAD